MSQKREKRIMLRSPEDVQEFVKTAAECKFDIDIFCQKTAIDGKSFLGVLSLELEQELLVKYWGDNEAFECVLQKYTNIC